MKTVDALREAPILAELDDDELTALADRVSVRDLARGETLFGQGGPVTGFYLLLSGKVRLFRSAPDGRELTLHAVDPGQFFAEAAAFGGGSGYPASCSALEDSRVACFDAAGFQQVLVEHPGVALKVIRALSQWLRVLTHKLEELRFMDVSERVAAFLLREHRRSRGAAFRLDTSKTELANDLGTVGETLSRTLRRFCDSGLITMKGRSFEVLDAEGLEAAAGGVFRREPGA